MNRECIRVARSTADRLMGCVGQRGVIFCKVVRTELPYAKTAYPPGRVNRGFQANLPKPIRVSGLNYVSTWQDWLSVAFVNCVYARRIVGWRVSRTIRTHFVLDASGQALSARRPKLDGGLIHHSDLGSRYVSIRITDRLAEVVNEPNGGSAVDACYNARTSTINALFKAELIARLRPWKTGESLELGALEWGPLLIQHKLLEHIGYIRLAEAQAKYCRRRAKQEGVRPDLNQKAFVKPRAAHIAKRLVSFAIN